MSQPEKDNFLSFLELSLSKDLVEKEQEERFSRKPLSAEISPLNFIRWSFLPLLLLLLRRVGNRGGAFFTYFCACYSILQHFALSLIKHTNQMVMSSFARALTDSILF